MKQYLEPDKEKLSHKTLWKEAQDLLLEEPLFNEDTNLQNMDKEDALGTLLCPGFILNHFLVCFEQVIKDLEIEYDEERDRKRVLERRMYRKNRERFIGLLDQMKSQGHIHSLAIFSDLYPRFITDKRFTEMLGQPGSTPLDLFKFYVKDLRDKLPAEKKMVKAALKSKNITILPETDFDNFTNDIADIKVRYSNLNGT